MVQAVLALVKPFVVRRLTRTRATAPTSAARLDARAHTHAHFMPAALLDSQLATLEAGADMTRVPVSADDDEASTVSKALHALQAA